MSSKLNIVFLLIHRLHLKKSIICQLNFTLYFSSFTNNMSPKLHFVFFFIHHLHLKESIICQLNFTLYVSSFIISTSKSQLSAKLYLVFFFIHHNNMSAKRHLVFFFIHHLHLKKSKVLNHIFPLISCFNSSCRHVNWAKPNGSPTQNINLKSSPKKLNLAL